MTEHLISIAFKIVWDLSYLSYLAVERAQREALQPHTRRGY